MQTKSIFTVAFLLLGGVALAAQTRADQAPGTAEQVAKGQTLFATCGGCHGMEGEGRVGMGPRLNSDSYLSIVSNDFLKTTITDGRAGTTMIPWGAAMQEPDIDALVSYIRSWQKSDGVVLDDSPLNPGTSDGAMLYRDICSRCHGRSAAGYSEAGSGTGIGRAAFMKQASDGMLRAVIKRGKDNTAMRPFDEDAPTAVANLTDEEIDAIIKYLRANAW
jgi:cytochrome c oxidase cbb3-type subunit III